MEYDRCILCNRPLKDKESKERGLGPVCNARVNKIVKSDRKKKQERKLLKEKIKPLSGQINIDDILKGVNNEMAD